MAISIDFKHRIPSVGTLGIHPRTAGLFMTTGFMLEGRHDLTVEVWTAPCSIGAAGLEPIDPNWRDKQVCLAVGTQLALTVPGSVNEAKGERMKRDGDSTTRQAARL